MRFPFSSLVRSLIRVLVLASLAAAASTTWAARNILAFDFAGLDHVLRQRGKAGLIAQRHAHVGQTAQQHALGAADLGQRSSERRQVIAPFRPVIGLPDVELFSAIHAEIKHLIRRKGKSFSAWRAVNVAANRRIQQRDVFLFFFKMLH